MAEKSTFSELLSFWKSRFLSCGLSCFIAILMKAQYYKGAHNSIILNQPSCIDLAYFL
ncbi:hypothetical protein FD28_GL001218 [Levilactobacillus hammesii DSM 16381]|uniref:Uncharacterized protein n=1 Tax=Levilactobacillus hammesii DSM 16381 TaxID=1423753 RepID=A0A0R1UJ35_9LACO|nr:hypothetical protein FD28_GL001218 [Levilactobacillus hammesii DSM 16381]